MPDETKLRELLERVSGIADYGDMEVKDVNTPSPFGDFPIHVVANWGDIDGLKILLDFGANINSKGEHGYSPLHEAVEQEKLEAVKFLLARGADPSIKNDDGSTPLDSAILYKNEKMIKLLSKSD